MSAFCWWQLRSLLGIFWRNGLRLLLLEGEEARVIKKISAPLAIKNFMDQVQQMKNLKQWWYRI